MCIRDRRKAVRAYFGIIRAVELDERSGFGGHCAVGDDPRAGLGGSVLKGIPAADGSDRICNHSAGNADGRAAQ